MPAGGELELFAVCPPGFEEVTAAELAEIGIRGSVGSGGVSWRGGLIDVYRANLHLRTATRVLARVARFRVRSFIELERHVRRIDWEPFVAEGAGVGLRVTSRKSKLYHERAIAERFARMMAEARGVRVTPAAAQAEDGDGEERPDAEQLVVVRFHRDECLVSADTSGESLHRRGYRLAVARAPLRENLAAGLLRASGWTPELPLLDPFCGSGTIPIEAALIARDIAPGLATADREPRRFAFARWAGFDPADWSAVVEAARARIRPAAEGEIHGSDRDAGAIDAALSNAGRAGVAEDLRLEVAPLSRVHPPAGAGFLVTNPPYGARVGETGSLRDLYAALGSFARERLGGWRVVLLSADEALDRHTRLAFEEVLRTRNGGIPTRLIAARA